MLISHESPIELFPYSQYYNDYNYLLFHLLTDPFYKENYLYRYSKKFTILDNSAYEFFIKGEEIDFKNFAEAIDLINPNIYIIPDKLMDKKGTIQLYEKWVKEGYLKKFSSNEEMVVIQGKTLKDWFKCLDYFISTTNISNIGISFHYSFLKELALEENSNIIFLEGEDGLYRRGREILMDKLFLSEKYSFLKNKYIHLLGSHGLQEFLYYKKQGYLPYISSMDSGYPIKMGMLYKRITLTKTDEKPNIILDDFLTSKVSKEQIEKILYNVFYFKQKLNS